MELSKKKCRECMLPIQVAEVMPHPEEEKSTGMAAYSVDEDFVGWICNDCAFKHAMTPGDGGMISGGGGQMEFHY